MASEYIIHLPTPHPRQAEFINSPARRLMCRSGRRSGKTVGSAIYAVKRFLAGRRILYAAPTEDQVNTFWFEVKKALLEPIDANVFYKNETMHLVEVPGTKNRIRAKTAWAADNLRGDYADVLILDEFQLMHESVWDVVGAPMLMDNNGTAIFIYTPPSLRSTTASRAEDPRYASKMFKKAQTEEARALAEGLPLRWQAFHFTSRENPYISQVALDEVASDMTATSYRQEILAEDLEEAPGALFHMTNIDQNRVTDYPEMDVIYIAVDPSGSARGDEVGIIAGGRKGRHYYALEDGSGHYSPEKWAEKAVEMYNRWQANKIIGEGNYGGEMVSYTITATHPNVPVELVNASRGKQVRAEPVAAIYEQNRAHHVGNLFKLEDELTMWEPGTNMPSPGRLDANVWCATKCMLLTGPSGEEWVKAIEARQKRLAEENQ